MKYAIAAVSDIKIAAETVIARNPTHFSKTSAEISGEKRTSPTWLPGLRWDKRHPVQGWSKALINQLGTSAEVTRTGADLRLRLKDESVWLMPFA